MTFFDYPGTDGAETDARPGAVSSAAPNAKTDYLLADASERDWADLLQVTTARNLVAGETLISSGAADRSLYLVVSGSLEVLLPSSRGRWRRVATVGGGSVIGEVAFFDGDARSALVRALAPVTVAELSPDDFADLAITRPDLALLLVMDLGRILAQRLRRIQSTPVVGVER